MADRRMFSKTIIDSDVFLDMPLSTQALYFHLSMRADDEGFVNNPKKIQRMIGASDDDLKILITKRYILTFESGIIVIKHWKIHNYIQTDRFKPTTYIEEKATLTLDEKKSYTECIQPVSKMEPQVSIELGKDSIEVSKKESNEKNNYYLDDTRTHERMSYDEIFESFGVEPELKRELIEFIRHCLMNNVQTTNDKLQGIIVKLDKVHLNDTQAKIDSVRNAISGGYFDIIENKR